MISVNNMTKLYNNGRGVRDLTFGITEGEVFGYLGPNGAGKTTTIRNLMGFLRPNKGKCTINGMDCWKESKTIQKYLGYIPGEITFLDEITGISFLKLMADMRKENTTNRMDYLLNFFQLDPSEKIKKMSKGMKYSAAAGSAVIITCFIFTLIGRIGHNTGMYGVVAHFSIFQFLQAPKIVNGEINIVINDLILFLISGIFSGAGILIFKNKDLPL